MKTLNELINDLIVLKEKGYGDFNMMSCYGGVDFELSDEPLVFTNVKEIYL